MDLVHDIQVRFYMRDCADAKAAVAQLLLLLPRQPEASTMHMRGWNVEAVCDSNFREVVRGDAEVRQLVYEAAEVYR